MSTISIGNETWNNLNKLRFSSRETFEEVIKRLIYENEKNIKHKE